MSSDRDDVEKWFDEARAFVARVREEIEKRTQAKVLQAEDP